jgi:hypothetical protein
MKVSSFQPMQGFEGASRAAAQKPAHTARPEPGTSPAEVISPEELRYFTKLYPEQTKEISSYSTYSKNGISHEFSSGSRFDQKS